MFVVRLIWMILLIDLNTDIIIVFPVFWHCHENANEDARYSAGKFCCSAGRRPFWLEECEWNDPVLSADCYIEQVSVQFRFNSTANPVQVTTWDDQLHTSNHTLEWRSFNPCTSQGRQFPLVCQGQLFYYVLQLLCAELLANFLSHICTRRLHPSLDKFSNCVANFYNIPIPFPYVKSSGGSTQWMLLLLLLLLLPIPQ